MLSERGNRILKRRTIRRAAFIFLRGVHYDCYFETRYYPPADIPLGGLAAGHESGCPYLPGQGGNHSRPGGRHQPGGHGAIKQPGNCGGSKTGQRAIQAGKPQVSSPGYGGGGKRLQNWRRIFWADCRSLLRGKRGAGGGHCSGREGGRCKLPARRRIQAPHLPLRLSGHGRRGHQAAAEGKGSHRAAHCDGADEHQHHRPVCGCRRDSDWGAEYAEL